jgi:hypothetical protein
MEELMKTIGQETFLSTEEAAKVLGITSRTLLRWACDEAGRPEHVPEIKFYIAPNGRRFFKTENIVEVVKKCYDVNLTNQDVLQMLRPAKKATQQQV